MASRPKLDEPEVHVLGQIHGATGLPADCAFCAFTIETGDQWECVGGADRGQTQVDYPEVNLVCSSNFSRMI